MSQGWFIFVEDHHRGPFSADDIAKSYQSGEIQNDTYLWKEGLDDWKHLYEIKDLLEADIKKDQQETVKQLEKMPDTTGIREIPYAIQNSSSGSENLEEDIFDDSGEYEDVTSPSHNIDRHEEVTRPSLELPEEEDLPIEHFGSPLEENFENEKVKKLEEQRELEKSKEKEAELASPPPLPPVKVAKPASEQNVEKPSLPTDEDFQQFNKPEEEFIPEISYEEASGHPSIKDTGRYKASFYQRWLPKMIVFFVLVFSLGIATYFYREFHLSFPDQPRGMTRNDYARLKDAYNEDPELRAAVEYAVSYSGDKIWMASNYKINSLMSVRITSLDGRIITDEKVQLSAEADYYNGFVEFSQFNLLEGKERVPGYYQVEISSVNPLPPRNFVDKIFLASKGKSLSLKEINHSKIIFWGNSKIGKDKFAKKLRIYKEHRRQEKSQYYDELALTYDTLLVFMGQIETYLFQILSEISTGRGIFKFKKVYQKNIAGPLQNFLIGSDKKFTELKRKKHPLADEFNKAIALIKELGELSTNIINQTKKYKRIGPKRKKWLKKRFSKKIVDLKKRLKLASKNIKEAGLKAQNLEKVR